MMREHGQRAQSGIPKNKGSGFGILEATIEFKI